MRLAHFALFCLTSTLFLACAPLGPEDEEVGEAADEVVGGTQILEEQSGYVEFLGCSGTLMTNEWVLTAAHCFGPNDIANPSFGVWMGLQDRVAEEVVLYPNADVAMIRLDSPMWMNGKSSGHERRLYPHRTNTLLPGTILRCSGYGISNWETRTGGGTLRTADLPVRGVNFNWWFHHYDLAVNINAQGQYTAYGDSGGSCLYTLPSGEQVLAGVISTVYRDIDGTFDGLVGADTFRSWYDNIRVTHEVVSDANGKCVDEYTNGSTITQRACNEGARQRWRIVPSLGGFWELHASDTGNCLLSITGNAIAAGECDGSPASHWVLSHMGNAFYEIRNGANNQCLDIPGASTAEGMVLQTYPCNGSSKQRWRFEARFSSAYQSLTPADAYGLACVDVAGASTSSGAPLQMYGCHGYDNQQWSLFQTTGDQHGLSPRSAFSQCLDVPWGAATYGLQVQQWQCVSGATNQQLRGYWRDGAYELRIKSSGQCLSVYTGAAAANHAPVVQYGCGAQGYSQRWFLY